MPEKGPGLERTFGIRAREILQGGPAALDSLPEPGTLLEMSAGERHRVLDRLRVELYGISSIISDAAVRRSLEARDRYPPYGLLRSLFSDFGVISASPSPIGEGAISEYRLLGKALIDTMVFHLDGYLKETRKSEDQWLVDRLGRLLALFKIDAGRQLQARMRDSFSFIYGGLQFGTSTCVQLAEVMARLLSSHANLDPSQKAGVMKRSIRPAYDLASLNVEDVAAAYARLQPESAGPDAGSLNNPAGWMDPAKFTVRYDDNVPSKVVLATDVTTDATRDAESADQAPRYTTQGCPARISPGGTRSPIGQLWEWTVVLAKDAGLLSPRSSSPPHDDPSLS